MAYPQTRFSNVAILDGSLVASRRRTVQANTLLYQLKVLRDTGRYDAFQLKWHPTYDEPPLVWPIPNHLFWDSDVAKWIEGACYFLKHESMPEIESAVHELVGMIRSAQQEDGYLNLHYTVVEPNKRFTNLRDMHELYNAGHLIEAALAHHDLFGDDLLLAPIVKYVDLLCRTFGAGPDQIHGYPGHPEIELALLRLHDRTGDPRHRDLAKYFLTERGNPHGCEGAHFYDVEARKRHDDPNKRPAFYPETRCMWYHQAHAPLVEQETIEGHAVRAVYLLTAVADLVRLEGAAHDVRLRTALYRLWDNMVEKKMYVTGGIGATKQWEGFNLDHFLPQGSDEGGCYSETCASIGVMMLAERLLQIELDSAVADIMELCFYNVVLTSMSHDGQCFTYDNQLASSNGSLSQRETWFTVACCPPNVLRLFGQIGGYVWAHRIAAKAADVTVHLYVPSTLSFLVEGEEVSITQDSRWPWQGDISFRVNEGSTPVTLRLRIPAWAKNVELEPPCPSSTVEGGYLVLPCEWVAVNRNFTFKIPLKPRWVAQHPYSASTISLARGPVVYCVEDFDNPWVEDHFKSVMVKPRSAVMEELVESGKGGDDYVALRLHDGAAVIDSERLRRRSPFMDVTELDTALADSKSIPDLKFVPYYLRANRGGKGQMRLGLRKWQ